MRMKRLGGDPSLDNDDWESVASDGIVTCFTGLWCVAEVKRRIELREGLMI